MIVCGKCGEHNEDDAAFCSSCGEFLEWDGKRVEEPADAAVATGPQQAVADATEEDARPAGLTPDSVPEAVRGETSASVATEPEELTPTVGVPPVGQPDGGPPSSAEQELAAAPSGRGVRASPGQEAHGRTGSARRRPFLHELRYRQRGHCAVLQALRGVARRT